MRKHLWEVKHPYYCHKEQTTSEYKSFLDFLAEFGEADLDYNLVFRWDWDEPEGLRGPDDSYRDGELTIFFFVQRKGYYIAATVDVCRADEPAVLAWLAPRVEHLRKVWEPLLDQPVPDSSVPSS